MSIRNNQVQHEFKEKSTIFLKFREWFNWYQKHLLLEPFTIMFPQNELLTSHVKEMFSFYLVRNECQKEINNFNRSAISVVDTECGQVNFTGHTIYPENEQTEVWEY